MFGLNFEPDAWAAIAAGTVLIARWAYLFARKFQQWAADAEPSIPIHPTGLLLSGIALATLAVSVASLIADGLSAPARYAIYVGVGIVNFIGGLFLDLVLNFKLSRFFDSLRAYRVPKYREQLSDPSLEIQLAATKRLFFAGRASAPVVPDLIAASRGELGEMRTYALLALWRTENEDPEVQRAAKSALHDPDGNVRAAAAVVLTRFKHPAEELLVPLCDGLAQHGHQIAISSFEALVEMGTAALPAVPAIRELILATDYPQTSGAVMILGKVGPEGVTVLSEVLERGNRNARLEALLALDEMREAARPALPALRKAAKDSDLRIRTSAAATLKRLGANVG